MARCSIRWTPRISRSSRCTTATASQQPRAETTGRGDSREVPQSGSRNRRRRSASLRLHPQRRMKIRPRTGPERPELEPCHAFTSLPIAPLTFPIPPCPTAWALPSCRKRIQFGRQTYREGVDISSEEFFRRLPHYAHPADAASAAADTFRELYAEKFRQNKQILSIHISSKMSETVALARQAADEFLGGNKIVVIDSLTTSIGLGLLVEAAAEAADATPAGRDRAHRARHDHAHVRRVLRRQSGLPGAQRALEQITGRAGHHAGHQAVPHHRRRRDHPDGKGSHPR